MTTRSMLVRWLAALTLFACLAADGGSARADQWLVPPGQDIRPATVVQTLARSRVFLQLGPVVAGLNASYASRMHYRLVALDTGAVTVLTDTEVESVKWTHDGKLVTLASEVNNPAHVVLVLTNFDGRGTSVVVLDGARRSSSLLLSAEQRLLLAEPPCDIGYAPMTDASGLACVDVDECALGIAKCSTTASCSNSTGSYTCTCKSGYSGDGTTCTLDDGGTAQATADSGTTLQPMAAGDAGLPLLGDAALALLAPHKAAKGCGCSTPAGHAPGAHAALALLAVCGVMVGRARRRARAQR